MFQPFLLSIQSLKLKAQIEKKCPSIKYQFVESTKLEEHFDPKINIFDGRFKKLLA
jgi:hypothetical protein